MEATVPFRQETSLPLILLFLLFISLPLLFGPFFSSGLQYLPIFFAFFILLYQLGNPLPWLWRCLTKHMLFIDHIRICSTTWLLIFIRALLLRCLLLNPCHFNHIYLHFFTLPIISFLALFIIFFTTVFFFFLGIFSLSPRSIEGLLDGLILLVVIVFNSFRFNCLIW